MAQPQLQLISPFLRRSLDLLNKLFGSKKIKFTCNKKPENSVLSSIFVGHFCPPVSGSAI
jgi:hypothetical protein